MNKGVAWNPELAKALDETRFGVFCVTPENKFEPWLNFEAGALSKNIGKAPEDKAYVCTYLIDLKETDLVGPLEKFQWTYATKEDTWRLVRDMNRAQEQPLPDKRLEEAFGVWWPHLEEKLKNLPSVGSGVPARRSTEEIQEETLEIVRRIEKTLTNEALRAEHVREAIKERRLSSYSSLADALAAQAAAEEHLFKSHIVPAALGRPPPPPSSMRQAFEVGKKTDEKGKK